MQNLPLARSGAFGVATCKCSFESCRSCLSVDVDSPVRAGTGKSCREGCLLIEVVSSLIGDTVESFSVSGWNFTEGSIALNGEVVEPGEGLKSN